LFIFSTGTTDNACDVTFQPAPTENEIQFILNEVRNYLHPDVEGILFCFILWLSIEYV
jgi:glycerol-3-phosphate dehydrogenase